VRKMERPAKQKMLTKKCSCMKATVHPRLNAIRPRRWIHLGPCRGNRDQIARERRADHIRFKMFRREIFNFCWPLLRIGPGLWNWGSNSTNTSRSYNSLFAPNPSAAAPLIERSIRTTDRFLPGLFDAPWLRLGCQK
jgi:hypothetical protein